MYLQTVEVGGRERRSGRHPVLQAIWGRALRITSLNSECP